MKSKEDKKVEIIVNVLNDDYLDEEANFKIDFKKQIFIGTTLGYYKGKLRLLFQTAQQDIVVYLNKTFQVKELFMDNHFFVRYRASFTQNEFVIPLVIFEVKYKNVNTHSIHTYSEIARKIKSIFPFCMYNFLLLDIDKKKEANRIYMTARNFDRIIYGKAPKTKSNSTVKTVWNIIIEHISYLQNNYRFLFE